MNPGMVTPELAGSDSAREGAEVNYVTIEG